MAMDDGQTISLGIFNALTGQNLAALPYAFGAAAPGMTAYAAMSDSQKQAVQAISDAIAARVIAYLKSAAVVTISGVTAGSSNATGGLS